MRTHDGSLKRFRREPRYPHHRSDGLTWRRNRGSQYQGAPVSDLFGLDIAGIVNDSLGDGLLPAKLVKLVAGERDPAATTSGPSQSRKTYPCRGVAIDFALSQFDGDIVQRGDRKVLLLGASLPRGVAPEASDLVQLEGVESQVIAVQRDPASASYTCHVRGA